MKSSKELFIEETAFLLAKQKRAIEKQLDKYEIDLVAGGQDINLVYWLIKRLHTEINRIISTTTTEINLLDPEEIDREYQKIKKKSLYEQLYKHSVFESLSAEMNLDINDLCEVAKDSDQVEKAMNVHKKLEENRNHETKMKKHYDRETYDVYISNRLEEIENE